MQEWTGEWIRSAAAWAQDTDTITIEGENVPTENRIHIADGTCACLVGGAKHNKGRHFVPLEVAAGWPWAPETSTVH